MKINNLQIVIFLIFTFLALQERSFTVARRVKKVTTKNMAVGRDGDYFSSRKEILPVERFARRKMTAEEIKGEKGKKVSRFVGNRKGVDEEDNFMPFASDYHPPKPHPPKNN